MNCVPELTSFSRWVVVPLALMYDSYAYIAKAVRIHQTAAKAVRAKKAKSS